MILAEVKSRVKSAAVFALSNCGQLSNSKLDDLLHECSDLLIVARGTDLIAVQIVHESASVVKEARVE